MDGTRKLKITPLPEGYTLGFGSIVFATMATLAPSRAKLEISHKRYRRAMDFPMPREAPVMNTV